MATQDILERLLVEQPTFHFVSEDDAAAAKNLTHQVGIKLEAGPISYAVPPEIIKHLATVVGKDALTIETGGGHTTVALAALAKHHICVNPGAKEVQSIKHYIERTDLPMDKVTFILERSDIALPKLSMRDKLDFAFIDGCHGYPFPALDWHYIDLNLKVGGVIAFDNTEIRAVRDHCTFLEQNRAYRLIDRFSFAGSKYGANFYLKLEDQEREWVWQPYNSDCTAYPCPTCAHNHHYVGPWVRNPLRRFKKVMCTILGRRQSG